MGISKICATQHPRTPGLITRRQVERLLFKESHCPVLRRPSSLALSCPATPVHDDKKHYILGQALKIETQGYSHHGSVARGTLFYLECNE